MVVGGKESGRVKYPKWGTSGEGPPRGRGNDWRKRRVTLLDSPDLLLVVSHAWMLHTLHVARGPVRVTEACPTQGAAPRQVHMRCDAKWYELTDRDGARPARTFLWKWQKMILSLRLCRCRECGRTYLLGM